MASTNFQDYNQNTPVVAAWLNDVNKLTYSAEGVPKQSLLIAVAWVRFNVTGGVVSIQQSSNVASVFRSGAGQYIITYSNNLTNAANCYEISQSSSGFTSYNTETNATVTINTANTSNVLTDPASCSVVIYGAN